jgi:hypothetical protein
MIHHPYVTSPYVLSLCDTTLKVHTDFFTTPYVLSLKERGVQNASFLIVMSLYVSSPMEKGVLSNFCFLIFLVWKRLETLSKTLSKQNATNLWVSRQFALTYPNLHIVSHTQQNYSNP